MEQNNQVTTAQQTQGAVARTHKQLFADERVKNHFGELLGKKAPGFIGSVLAVCNSPALIGSDPKTTLNAASIAATLDLPINPNLGFAYLVAYNDKRLGKQTQFQMGYKGFIQLAMRSGLYKTINATEVYEGELEVVNRFTGEFKYGKRTGDKVVGYMAYFQLLNGFEKYFYMSKEEMDTHATKYSQSFRNDKYGTSLWKTQYDSMAKKTVLKLLISKFGPLSIEMQAAQKFDQAVIPASIDATQESIDEIEIDYIDNQQEEQEPAQASSSIADAMAKASEQFKKESSTKETELF